MPPPSYSPVDSRTHQHSLRRPRPSTRPDPGAQEGIMSGYVLANVSWGNEEERQARWRCSAELPGVAIPDHPVAARPKGLKSLKLGSVRGFGSRKARSRVGHGIGSGLHPVFTSKYLAAVATEG